MNFITTFDAVKRRSIVLVMIIGTVWSRADSIPWAQVPPAAQTIAKAFVDKPEELERKTENNQVVFHITGSKEGKDAELDVTSGGKLLNSEQEVAFAELNPAVQKEIRALSQNSKLSSISKIFDGQQITYELEVAKGKQEISFSLDALGHVISTEEVMPFDALPLPAQKTIRLEIGSAKIESITKVVEEGETSYDIEAKRNGKTLELSVDSDGDLISMDVPLSQLPKLVQEAVREKTAESKLERISKSTEGGDIFYDVETRKGDREILLSFGDDGLLSSEDERVSLAQLPAALQKAIHAEEPHQSRIAAIWCCQDEDGTAYDVEFSKSGEPQRTIRFVDSNDGYHAQK